MMFIVS